MKALSYTILTMLVIITKAQSGAELLYNRGMEKYSAGDFTGAIKTFDKLLLIDPANYKAFYERGRAKHELKRYVEAIHDFSKALEINPKFTKAYYIRGYTKFIIGNFRGAVGDFNRTLELNPKSALAYAYRGEAKINLGEKKNACDDWAQAFQLGYYNVADLVEKHCDLSLLPQDQFASFLVERGDKKFNKGDFEGALKEYNKAIDLIPEDGQAYFSRGIVKLLQEKPEDACKDWETAIKYGNIEAKDMFKQHCN